MAHAHERIVILDFGSQYTQLIARRIRELGVYSEIHPYTLSLDALRSKSPIAVILSGGPSSCYAEGAPNIDKAVFELGVPVLGICYGAQLTAKLLGGDVTAAEKREYGRAEVTIGDDENLFADLRKGSELSVWMSHGDRVASIPDGFSYIGKSDNCEAAAFADTKRNIYCVQFHPEVAHTEQGEKIISNFIFKITGAKGDWSMASYAEEASKALAKTVAPDERVICGLSGGVDSSVVAALLHKAIGDRLTCIFVDNGLLRSGERDYVASMFRDHFPTDLRVIDAEERFLTALEGVTDPEKKRKIIGEVFIRVFEDEAKSISNAKWLAQGTLYPDVIESVSVKGGPSVVIKSHHNVGGLPERMNFELIEPLRELFKDEVRVLGQELGLPRDMVMRQPFPGPGLAVRCLGSIEKERLETLRAADRIIDEEIRGAGLYEEIWQSFGVILPVKTVGVMGDQRTYADVLAIRSVGSRDGMTADWTHLPYELLGTMSRRIINEVHGVNRVVYDITSKPPGTIEWE